ncbi:hypothetical protein [Pseudobacter ginsenosidimutans]|uniref:Uncharacterized protein n=1 Tax=Pseudobacter ginsenosidimutans TaxID=661488 RepID=A0A4Q7MP27_9BACT|nr:hypothetical protein [Pseudobacter ginsenosidimutans]QEC45704.1 hypothetical protein FSB84_29925 [Pseudobacter ginsenosidimutans]RZS69358.1 hypothetical protein EV199_5195 [Pseudobacter ginsenosidimutans]
MNIIKRPWFAPALVLFFVTVIAAENFILPFTQITEVKEANDFEISRTSPTRSHSTRWLIAASGRRYNVSAPPYNYLSKGDSFIIYRSLIFKKPLKISWCEPDGCYIMAMGTMNGNYISLIALGALAIWALLNLLGIIKPSPERKGHWNTVAIGISGALFIFYLWY